MTVVVESGATSLGAGPLAASFVPSVLLDASVLPLASPLPLPLFDVTPPSSPRASPGLESLLEQLATNTKPSDIA
ncbi:hypothetical protein AKJ09_05900 [Labilithrix luteola]|uniref:Uncharacterized protein n=1 Tax=Labilithrix luteola TaxID=1391654 RepID=A0A0K1Q0U1_9BACT|nr:hypothetical protein AKJ09_05900 [Labilithrix luteola]